jgi:hypothetical protein
MNKAIMQTWRFPNTLLLVQNTVTVLAQVAACKLGVKGFDMKPWRISHVPKWTVVSLVFTGEQLDAPLAAAVADPVVPAPGRMAVCTLPDHAQ